MEGKVMTKVTITVGEESVTLNTGSYERAFAAFELLMRDMPRTEEWQVRFDPNAPNAKKICMIKSVREVTKCGLHDGKQSVEMGAVTVIGEAAARQLADLVAKDGAVVTAVERVA